MSKKADSPRKAPRPPGRVPEEFRKFEDFVRKVVTVPKSEIDRRDADYHHKKLQKNSKTLQD
jgi:hypothetical protein